MRIPDHQAPSRTTRAKRKNSPRVIAALDIGTNSIRLEVVRVEPDHSLSTLTQQKEMVRLGEGEFATNRMTAAAIERGALVCARFADMARGFGADEIIALATSAVREAENQHEFVERVREEADLDVRVISGPEEARLIYLGVVNGASIGESRALFIDIGGGSTELIIGDAHQFHSLDSLKLGAIRLTNRFLPNHTSAVSPAQFQQMKAHARALSSQSTRHALERKFDLVYGSAGTITNLADVTARRLGEAPTTLRNYSLKVSALQETVQILCRLPLSERRKTPGLDPERADIVIGGAAVLLTLLEDVHAEQIHVSDLGLRYGIIIDALMREDSARETYEATPVRLRSILQLARTCGFDEAHARHIATLSAMIFDELARLGRHPYGHRERELLTYAALTHDIGTFLSHSNHQRHAYYLVRHSDLLGFNDSEIAIIANVALYHRKSIPKKRHGNLQALTGGERRLITALSAILRVAEGLDRSHLALVKSVRLERIRKPSRIQMTLFAEGDCQLEIWGVENSRDLFQIAFGLPLSAGVEVLSASASEDVPKENGNGLVSTLSHRV